MTTLTTAAVATLPRVNLLPPEIAEERRFARLRLALGATVFAGAAVVAALYLHAANGVRDAEEELAYTQSRNATLTQQAMEYDHVPVIYKRVEDAQDQLTLAMSQEVRWSYYLNDLSRTLPDRVWIETMTVTVSDVPAAPTEAAPSAEAVTPIYAVTFSGKAFTHDDVAEWLDSLAEQKGYANPYFTLSELEPEGEEKPAKFDSSVAVTADALSRRYTEGAGK